MTGKSQGGCNAALAEIADHARGDAGDELPGRAALAVGVRRGYPQLSQPRGRRHHGGADVGVPAEDSSEAVVWRFRSPHRSRGETEMRSSEPKRPERLDG